MDRSKFTPEEREEIAAAARDLSNSQPFKLVLSVLRDNYVQELLGTPVGSLTAQDAHASMRVLERVRNDIANLSVFNRK